ncbi:MAG: mannose-1-phosphate guanylyltransferase [Planctomycetaceae bacterium]|jgi:mannose-1-phosphate guanylyltransferase|nr:mannose-1-phosphate guanylyltransferase [Planctomycetaceae bacterium]
MLHAVILAGGSGTRLWPESRQSKAKQFLEIESGRTMIESTVARLERIIPHERMWVLTTESMSEQIATLLPQIPQTQIICEPIPRNTAPCIGLAAARISNEFPDATMIILPSDHVIRNENSFCQTLQFAADLVDEDSKRLVTLGIKPTFPSSSYGYIETNDLIISSATQKWQSLTTVHNVRCFHEKPSRDNAVKFIKSGNFAWNAGIFIWRSATIIDLIAKFEPETGDILKRIADKFGSVDEKKTIENLFPQCKNISIDYAVLERVNSTCPNYSKISETEHANAESRSNFRAGYGIVMLEAVFDWDDVGTWSAIDRLYSGKHDEHNNIAITTKLIAIDSSGCFVRADNPEHLFALIGINDVIVVQSNNATLIAKKEHEEAVRKIINELKEKDWKEFL